MKNTKHFYEFILISLLSFFWIISTQATNYHVSNSGSDLADGKSPSNAWETIKKVNSQSFLPGDSIKFKCGDRWFEAMKINSSGTPNSYIAITNYGTGAKPKLYGSIPATSFIAHPSRANVYRIDEFIDYELYYGIPGSSSRASLYHILKDTLIWSDGRLDRETDFSNLDENFKFLWQNDSVYFFYDGDITDIDTIEVTQAAWGITLGGEYITIDGLDLKYWASRGIGVDNYPEVTKHGFQLRNCEIAYTASKEEAVGYGIAIGYSDMLIEHNKAHDNGRRNLSLNLVANTGSAIMRNVIVQDNELYSGYHTTGVDMSMHSADQQIKNITIRRNKIWDSYGGNGFKSESIFLQNYEGIAPEENYDSIYIYNNLLLNTTLDGVYLEHQGRHVYIVNNTFTGAGSRAFIFNTTSNAHHTIMNNIFCNYAPEQMQAIDGAVDGTTILDTCNYNLYYTGNNPNASYIWYQMFGTYFYFADGWPSIQALGYELDSPDPQAPHFNDSITDLRLKPGSPAIGAGKPISFVTTDYLGNQRDLLTPDIGAYEYGSNAPSSIGNTKDINDLFSIYPNPATDNLTIKISDGYNDTYIVELFNIQGKRVYKTELFNCKELNINTASYSSGVYFIKLSSANLQIDMAKIIIQ